LLLGVCKVFTANGVLSAGTGNDFGHSHRVIIGTFQTVMRRAKRLKIPTVIIIDECHLVPENSRYSDLLERFPEATVIGLTATPFRGRAHIVACGLDWESIYSVSISHLIEQKYLVPPRSMATPANVEVRDADERPRRDAVTKAIVAPLIASVIKEGRRKCLVFCSDIAHAKFTVDQLRRAGEQQVYLVHSKQTKRVQDAQFAAFENSLQRAWLVNVTIVSIGVDIPAVDCIAILRDIRSFALLVQIIGRGLRLFEGKLDCLVYDFGSGTRRFGFVDDPQFGEVGAGHGHRLLPMKTCPGCGGLMHVATMECVRCGKDFPTSTRLKPNAIASQILSDDFRMATYDCAYLSKKHDSLWCIEHHLYLQGDECVRAFEMRPGPEAPVFVSLEQGAPILIKRIDRDIVEMLGYQVDPRGRRAWSGQIA
jgi:DNA repair protein RadD